jgi:hypothetical protein
LRFNHADQAFHYRTGPDELENIALLTGPGPMRAMQSRDATAQQAGEE